MGSNSLLDNKYYDRLNVNRLQVNALKALSIQNGDNQFQEQLT